MQLQADGSFTPSSIMIYPYFILAEESFAKGTPESAINLFNLIYDEHAEAFKIKEPNDPNYIAVADVVAKYLTPEEYAGKPWLSARRPIWENSNCIVVQNGSYQKIQPDSLAGYVGMS